MKKVSLQTLVTFIDSMDAQGSAPQEILEVRDEIEAELNRNEAKAQANRDLYAQAKNTIMGALSDTPATIAEIYDEVAGDLPDGFTKSKVQYAITRLWKDEVTKVEGKTNGYCRKA